MTSPSWTLAPFPINRVSVNRPFCPTICGTVTLELWIASTTPVSLSSRGVLAGCCGGAGFPDRVSALVGTHEDRRNNAKRSTDKRKLPPLDSSKVEISIHRHPLPAFRFNRLLPTVQNRQ